MRKNLSVEREFEREILDHQAFLRNEEEAARLEYEVEAEYGQDWEEDLPGDVEYEYWKMLGGCPED